MEAGLKIHNGMSNRENAFLNQKTKEFECIQSPKTKRRLNQCAKKKRNETKMKYSQNG